MAGGVQTTGSLPRFLQEGLARVFDQSYDEHPMEYTAIFDSETSKKAFEIDAQFENFGPATFKDEGRDIEFDSAQQGILPRYKHLTAAKGYIITKEALADDLYGVLSKQTKALAFSMVQLKEITAANILNNGFDTSFTQPGGDGQPLFSKLHIAGPSGLTYSNEIAVNADLAESSLEDLLIQISQAQDTRGNQVKINPIRLVIPPALAFEAQRILFSVLQSGNANNDVNAIQSMSALTDNFVVNHYLTDTDAFFIKTNAGGNPGLTHWTRQEKEFGQDNAFSSGNARMKCDERYSFGWTLAKSVYGSAGSV